MASATCCATNAGGLIQISYGPMTDYLGDLDSAVAALLEQPPQ
jgi:hypothetical protein